MVSVDVSRMGKTGIVFVEPGAKVNSEYYCQHVLGGGLLPDIRTRCQRYSWTLHCSRTAHRHTLLGTHWRTCGVRTSRSSSLTYEAPKQPGLECSRLRCLGCPSADGLSSSTIHNNQPDLGVGCFIGETFVGALAYADDIVLVTPSASAMCKLLRICDVYAAEYCISFNANKSKCMVMSPTLRDSVLLYRMLLH